MFSYLWPMLLVVVSNALYQVCAKSVPSELNPFASLTITYLISAFASLILFLVFRNGSTLVQEYRQLNWTSFILGVVIVGLEAGCIFAYKNGWQLNSFQIVQGALLGIVLIFVGKIVFAEQITLSKILGIIICLIGLYFINR